MTDEERAETAEERHRTEEKVEEAHRPDALILHEIIRREGEEELRRTAFALTLSGFAAGLTMGFSLIVPGVLKAHLPEAPWAELVSSVGYSIGFLIVVLGRQQLFTENTVTPDVEDASLTAVRAKVRGSESRPGTVVGTSSSPSSTSSVAV